jgi:hypothetical protein
MRTEPFDKLKTAPVEACCRALRQAQGTCDSAVLTLSKASGHMRPGTVLSLSKASGHMRPGTVLSLSNGSVHNSNERQSSSRSELAVRLYPSIRQ